MLYLTARMVVAPALRALWRPTVTGTRNVPRSGGVILASNHLSFVDSVVIPTVAPRQVHFLAKADYFTAPGVQGAVQRAWFTTMGMVPVERDDQRAATAALDVPLRLLAEGRAFGIYPEGTRSRDGRLYRGRTGVGHLALQADVPVVPVGLSGTEQIQAVGESRPRVARCTVRFGEPISFRGALAGVPAGCARREATDQVMAAIAELTGQEVVPRYNDRPSGPAS